MFKWRPGRAARYKKTEICQTCSKLKNVCQVCILDLEYSLPVQVRDTALNIITHNDSYSKKPCQNREYFAEEHDRMVLLTDFVFECLTYVASLVIFDYFSFSESSKKEPHYEKNQPNVCSFNTIGKCTRGAGCAFRHEMPKTEELSHQP